jgi:small subunit ribosomal protein S20
VSNHKSALKRANQNEVRRIRNRAVKTRVKNVIKEVRQAATGTAADTTAAATLLTAQSAIDKAVKKGVLHKRTAARKIARLAKLTQAAKS